MKTAEKTVKEEPSFDLAAIEEVNIANFFHPETGLVDLALKKIRETYDDGEVIDPTTPEGRKRINVKAKQVSSVKAFLDGQGKEHVADIKKRIKLVDDLRKRFRDGCDEVRDAILKPKTEWEEKEAARVAAIQQSIDRLNSFVEVSYAESGQALEAMEEVARVYKKADYSELSEAAKERYSKVTDLLKQDYERLLKQEEEQKERDRVAKENEELRRKLEEQQAELERAKREAAEMEAAKAAEAPDPSPDMGEEPETPPEQPETGETGEESPITMEEQERRRDIHNAIKDCLMADCALDEVQAKSVVVSVVRKRIPNLTVNYDL